MRLKGIYTKAEEVETKGGISSGVFSHSPLATKLHLKLPLPDLKDNLSDLERLYREICRIQNIEIMQTGLANVRKLGQLLRTSNWEITTTLGKRNDTVEIVLIQPGDTSLRNYGIAFDIGTTTISAQLIDLNAKKILGTKATYNKQATFGSDIITRIIAAKEETGLERLHHAVIDGMNDMTKELAVENSIDLNDVTCCVCAGNTTMIHLLLKVDPRYIRKEPYIPTANFVPVTRAAESGIKINPRGLLGCVPGVSSYVGGDITAGILACGLYKEKELSLLIDAGTNGEIVLGNKDWLICASASAGPAFEGSGVTCGMRASKGAIEKIKLSKKLDSDLETISNAPARGICGSGYIDILSELIKIGIIDKNGRIKSDIKSDRLRKGEFGREFVVAFKKEKKKVDCNLDRDIVITETDIANLKRAKAAIFAAACILTKHMGFDFKDVRKVFIAGGFGTCLDIKRAISIGLLPDLPEKRFLFVGNSSLAGSRQILLSYDAMKQAEEIARKTTYFELSTDSHYMEEYTAALFFPHTDLTRFPSVKK